MSSKSKRILILTTSYLPLIGGSELAIKEVTDRLKGYEFDLITARTLRELPREERIGAVNVFRVGNSFNLGHFLLPKNFLPLAIFFRARSLLKTRRYDWVHVFQASQAGGAAWLLKLINPRLPLLITLQEGKDLRSQNWLRRFFRWLIIRRADRVSVISNYLKIYALSIKKSLPVKLIPNGVDLENFSREFSYGETSQLCDRLGILPGDKVIISASRLTLKNGIDNLIKAVRMLIKQNPSESYRLLLAGEGEMKVAYQSLAEELGMADRVIFAGTVDHSNLPKYLKIAHVFVRPSRSEGLGSSFLEAMAAGIPIVGPALGGITDFLTDGETGLVCDPLNPDNIAEKISTLITDENLRRKVIKNGQELVRQKYDWNQIAKEYEHIYS